MINEGIFGLPSSQPKFVFDPEIDGQDVTQRVRFESHGLDGGYEITTGAVAGDVVSINGNLPGGFHVAAPSTAQWRGRLWPILDPGGEWAVEVNMASCALQFIDYTLAGLVISSDSVGTKTYMIIGLGQHNATGNVPGSFYIDRLNWIGAAFTGVISGFATTLSDEAWIRVERTRAASLNLSAGFSRNGAGWTRFPPWTEQFVPAYYGFAWYNTAAITAEFSFKTVRQGNLVLPRRSLGGYRDISNEIL